jgi:hypothetical protein
MILRKTLSIMLVLGLVIGGIPLFFSTSAEAATSVHESRQGANSIWHSNGYLHVDVSRFAEEGGNIIPGYVMLIEYDFCRKDLNPLSGFFNTVREHRTATIITDQKGEASFEFDIPNMCWTENAWLTGASDSWQSVNYYLGQMASTSLSLNINVQPSGASAYAHARADTLGIINDWYKVKPYAFESNAPTGKTIVYGSQTYAGSTKLIMCTSTSAATATPSTTFGKIVDYKYTAINKLHTNSGTSTGTVVEGNWYNDTIRQAFGDEATLIGDITAKGGLKPVSRSPSNPDVWMIKDAEINGPEIRVKLPYNTYPLQDKLYYKFYVNGIQAYPNDGAWLKGSVDAEFYVPLPFNAGQIGFMDLEIHVYTTGEDKTYNGIGLEIYPPQKAEFVLSELTSEHTSTTINVFSGQPITVDLTGHWGEWQISGMSSTLTNEDLVPVNARITSIYPMVISNPRFDKTPIAGGTNGLKFDAYNLRSTASNETIYLSLIADRNTTVWSTTVGQTLYPEWAGSSKFTTVHLTDIAFPSEPRKEYTLRITSGGAITEIPVVFYPPELDPDTVYDPKKDLDEISGAYSKISPAALKAYYDWAVGMEIRNVEMQSIIGNYSKIFEDSDAVSSLESAQAASDRAKEMIAQIKVICKGDGTDTNIGELKTLGNGIWSSYLAALMYREAAVAYEAGQDAFANSSALDAWYADLISKRIKTGMQDEQKEEDSRSSAGWIALGVALLAGGVTSYLIWSKANLKRYMPKPRGAPWMRLMIRWAPLIIAIVAGIIVAVIAFMISLEVVAAIEGALAGLGEMFG